MGDSKILVVRMDPELWELEILSKSRAGLKDGRTAREWARSSDMVVVTNAGMFAADYTTHLAYMESKGHVNAKRLNAYMSVAAFGAREAAKSEPFRIFDLDEPGVSLQGIREAYDSVVQNLRLVRRPGTNRWGRQGKRWSEAALGEDREGNILFVFSRSPLSMRNFNVELLAAGIGLVALQHLEGGPEAQLYLKIGDLEIDAFGSYETGFREDDTNRAAWPIPNALGVKRRPGVK